MFYQPLVTQRLTILAVVIVALPGCHIVEECCRGPEGERFLGTVRTGGPLAASRTIPIPLEGLTLSNAVEMSIRPGLLTAAGGGVSAPPTPPIGQQKLTIEQAVQTIVNGIRPAGLITPAEWDQTVNENIGAAVDDLARLGDHSTALKDNLGIQLEKARDDDLFKPLTLDPAANQQLRAKYVKLRSDIEAILNAPVPSVENPNATTSPAPPTTSDRIAVRLTRRSGNRVIVPLPMVRTYSPGDIWLTDGDQIQIMPLGITEAGQKLPRLDGAAISELQFDQPRGVNLLILTHRSILDGRPEQYMIPASNQAYYGNASFVAQWQNAVYKQGNDVLTAGSLETNPLIRKSQINSVAATAAAVEEQINPTVKTLTQTIHQKIERSKTIVGGLPVISQVRNQIEQQVGPVSFPGNVQRNVRFDREEFCRSLTP